MLIQVIRADNQYDYVKDFMLDLLIASKQIVKFRRSSGWVTIGVDPIRKGKRTGLRMGTPKKETDHEQQRPVRTHDAG